MKTALVTGSEGFAGRHYVRLLEGCGYSVVGIDNAHSSEPSDDALYFFQYAEGFFDLVIHCAAVVGGRQVIDGPALALAVDLQLDAALFRWALRTRPGRIVYVSSSAAYPVTHQKLEFRHALLEDDLSLANPGMPDQLYGWAKLTGEILAARARQEGLKVTVIRPFSGYGEDQDPAYPFRAFAERARAREAPFEIWGSAHQCRDFIHIDDIVDATMVMVEQGIDGPVNLGTGRPTSMSVLAALFCLEAGYTPRFHVKPDAPMGVGYRVADITLMKQFYTPKITLEEGVRRALAWDSEA